MTRIYTYHPNVGTGQRSEGPELDIGDVVGTWPSEWIVTSMEINREQDWQRLDLYPRVSVVVENW